MAFGIKPIFAWYDFWIGLFWDKSKRKLYFFPIPCFGFILSFSTRIYMTTYSTIAITLNEIEALALDNLAAQTSGDREQIIRELVLGAIQPYMPQPSTTDSN